VIGSTARKVEFHERVREAYLEIAKANPNRVRVIDAKAQLSKPRVSYGIVISFLEGKGCLGEERRAQSRAPEADK
jgi:hypothetical protein